MLGKFKLAAGQWLDNPTKVRVMLILGTLLIAALIGAAPHDSGG